MGVTWEKEALKEEKQSTGNVVWQPTESNVTAHGVATSFFSGMYKNLFHLTGGSALEFVIDDENFKKAGQAEKSAMLSEFGLNDEMTHAIDKMPNYGMDAVQWGKEITGVNHEASNSAERVAERAGEDLIIGAMAAAGTILTGGAATTAPAALELAGAKTAERVTASIVHAFKTSPMAASIYEMIGTSTSGGAIQAVSEGGGGPVAQTAAGVAGAMTPLAPRLVWRGIQHSAIGLFNKLFKDSQKRAIQDVAKALKTGIGDMSDFVKSNAVFERINATKRPSVAEASNSPQLIAKQKEIEASSSGSELDNYVKRHQENLEDLERSAQSIGPDESYKDMETIIDAARVRMDAARGEVIAARADIRTKTEATGSRLPESTDRIAAGRQLRELRKSIKQSVKDNFAEEAEGLGLNNPGTDFDVTTLRGRIVKAFFDKRSQFAAKIKNKTLKRIKGFKEEVDADGKGTGEYRMTWDDLTAIRSTLNDDISTLLAKGQRNKARELIKAKDMLDEFVETSAPNGVDPQKWASFRARWREGFIERFEQNTSYKVGGKNQRSEYFTNDEMVADAFLQNESSVADFFNLYGSQADEALPLLRTAILDRARKATVVDGIVDEKKLGRFIDSGPLSKILRAFPLIRRELTDIRMSTKALSLRSGVLKARANEIESSALNKIISLSGDPEEMLTAALKDPKLMQTLVRTSERAGLGGRPVASLVWKRATAELSKEGAPTPDALLKFIETHRRSLNVALGRKHAERLHDLYQAAEIYSRVGIPTGKPASSNLPDRIQEATGISVPQIGSRIYAYSAGLIGKRHAMFESAVRFYGKFSKRKADALMKEALFDKNIARDISLLMDSPATVAQERLLSLPEARLNAALFNMGLGDSDPLQE